MEIGYWNINRYTREKSNAIEDVAKGLDILCLAETKTENLQILNEELTIPDDLNIEPTTTTTNGDLRHRSGGLAVIVRKGKTATLISKTDITITVKFQRFWYVFVYLKPTCNDDDWETLNQELLEASKISNGRYFVLGDFNTRIGQRDDLEDIDGYQGYQGIKVSRYQG